MTRCGQPIDNRVNHIVVRGEKFTTDRGDFNSNLVIWRNQRRPRPGHVRLAGHGKNETIHHRVHQARVSFVIFNRIRIVHGVNDGWSRR